MIQHYSGFHKASDLPMSCPVNELINFDLCQTVSTTLLDQCARWKTEKVSNGLYRSLPDSPGIYMFVWSPPIQFKFEDEFERLRHILYVGKAEKSLQDRFKQEYKNYFNDRFELLWTEEPKNRTGRLEKYFQLRPLFYWYSEVKDLDTINYLESRLIEILSPPLNVQRPKGKVKPPVPAF